MIENTNTGRIAYNQSESNTDEIIKNSVDIFSPYKCVSSLFNGLIAKVGENPNTRTHVVVYKNQRGSRETYVAV